MTPEPTSPLPDELPPEPSPLEGDPSGDLSGDLGGAKSLTLAPEQLDALGLAGCKPGDSYTIRVTKGEGDTFTVDGVDAPLDQESGGDVPDLSAPLEGDEPAPDLEAPPEEDPGLTGGIPTKRARPTNKPPLDLGKLRNI